MSGPTPYLAGAAGGRVASWILAFNARWQVELTDNSLCHEGTVSLVRARGDDYLSFVWCLGRDPVHPLLKW